MVGDDAAASRRASRETMAESVGSAAVAALRGDPNWAAALRGERRCVAERPEADRETREMTWEREDRRHDGPSLASAFAAAFAAAVVRGLFPRHQLSR